MALLVVFAPSGTGKSSLIESLMVKDAQLHLAVSHTTRPKRQGEIDGHNYHFVSESKFQQLIAENAFVEYANVYGNFYGTSRNQLEMQQKRGEDVLLEIDSQGAKQVKKVFSDAILIAIVPPSEQEVRVRLINRAKDSQQIIEQRMNSFHHELLQVHIADYVVMNDDFNKAVENLHTIVVAQRLRYETMRSTYEHLLRVH